jgi:PAS domain S-box-containing protein
VSHTTEHPAVSEGLRTFAEHHDEGILVVCEDGCVRYANREAAVLLRGDADADLTDGPATDLLVPGASPGGAMQDLVAAIERSSTRSDPEEPPLRLRAVGDGTATRLSAAVEDVEGGWTLTLDEAVGAADTSPGDRAAAPVDPDTDTDTDSAPSQEEDGPVASLHERATTEGNIDADDYRRALETAGDGIAILDAEERYRYVNSAHASMYGYERGALIGRSWTELYDDEEVSRLSTEAVSAIDDGGEWREEAVGRRRDGEPFPQELALSRLPDGGYICVVRDRTGRDRRERTLEALHEATRDLLGATDRECAAEVAVDAATHALDLPLSAVYLADEMGEQLEPAARSETVAAAFDDLPTFDGGAESLAWEAYTTGEAQEFFDAATADVYNDDTPAEAELVLPLGDHGALITGHLGDGSFDAESVRLAHTLAASLTTALDRAAATDRLREQNDQLERLSAVLSHDLRDPLNTAMATTTLAQAEAGADAPIAERLDELDGIHTRMESLIEEVLTLAGGLSSADPEDVAVGTVAREAWEAVRLATDDATDGDPTLVVEASGTVRADETHLRRLLENLFGNAIHHGGPDVTVRLDGHSDGFTVADDGPGIPPDKREQVFERGYTGSGGTGLGLAIVDAVADAHGWDIAVAESLSGGARFDVTGVRRPEGGWS